MLTLGLHCAGAFCDVALSENGRIIGEMRETMTRGYDQRLPILTESVVSSAGITFKDIDRFAVCVGPGSFTGIRVGVAFARGLALANGSTAIGVSSLESMIANPEDQIDVAILPARQRLPDLSFWVQRFTRTVPDDPAEIDADKLEVHCAGIRRGVCSAEALENAQSFAPEIDWHIAEAKAANIALFAERNDAWRPATPVYVRAPDAIPAKPVV